MIIKLWPCARQPLLSTALKLLDSDTGRLIYGPWAYTEGEEFAATTRLAVIQTAEVPWRGLANPPPLVLRASRRSHLHLDILRRAGEAEPLASDLVCRHVRK